MSDSSPETVEEQEEQMVAADVAEASEPAIEPAAVEVTTEQADAVVVDGQPDAAVEADVPAPDRDEAAAAVEEDDDETVEVVVETAEAGESAETVEAGDEAASGEAAEPATAANGAVEAPEAAPGVPGVDWYIIHTYSGFENKVKESLRTRAEAFGFEERIGEILIPTEDVVEMRNGKKITSKRLLYPGYVLVQLLLDDELWHVVKNTPRVTGFVGGGHDPQPLTADEVNQILYRQVTSAERPRPKMEFTRNDRVKIVDGPFSSFTGTIEEVNEDRSTVKVMVTIFGRGTPVELEYFQVEKES